VKTDFVEIDGQISLVVAHAQRRYRHDGNSCKYLFCGAFYDRNLYAFIIEFAQGWKMAPKKT